MSRQRQKTAKAAKLSAADAERLNSWVSKIAQELRPGAPVRTESGGAIRIGSKGSLAIRSEAGVWYDHEAGKGGVTALSLIEHLLGETSSPVPWAQKFLHLHEGAGPLSPGLQNDTRREADKATG